MTRNDSAHVFNAYVPLNHTEGQVSQLPPDADDESYQDTVPRLEVREGEAEYPWQDQGNDQSAQRPFPGLVRADIDCGMAAGP